MAIKKTDNPEVSEGRRDTVNTPSIAKCLLQTAAAAECSFCGLRLLQTVAAANCGRCGMRLEHSTPESLNFSKI